jgi:hypothetical protein
MSLSARGILVLNFSYFGLDPLLEMFLGDSLRYSGQHHWASSLGIAAHNVSHQMIVVDD